MLNETLLEIGSGISHWNLPQPLRDRPFSNLFSVAVIDTMSKVTWSHGALVSAYRLQSATEGSQGRISSKNRKAETEAKSMEECLVLAWLQAHKHLPFMDCSDPPAHNRLGTPTSIAIQEIQKCTPQTCPQAIWWKQLFEIPVPSVTSWQPRSAIPGLMGSFQVIGYVALKGTGRLNSFSFLSLSLAITTHTHTTGPKQQSQPTMDSNL